jgi:hypothetical protein
MLGTVVKLLKTLHSDAERGQLSPSPFFSLFP